MSDEMIFTPETITNAAKQINALAESTAGGLKGLTMGSSKGGVPDSITALSDALDEMGKALCAVMRKTAGLLDAAAQKLEATDKRIGAKY